jgi:Mlc titration factor MtfA (ptsG expression regulator)
MSLLKKWRRKRIGHRPFPDNWQFILKDNVPYYNRLKEEDRQELHRHIMVFLSEKKFEGCGGLKIIDEIKVTIAAQACILLLHRKTDYYPGLNSILVYPSSFLVPHTSVFESGLVIEGPVPLRGQSWHRGPVVLSWDDVKHSTADARDGHNVVFHEFAHQIDSAAGEGDSSAVLRRRSSFIAWARVLQKDYERLRLAADDNLPSLLDKYGATNPAEFFAVATEFFFERPAELQKHHPELYNELKNFYHQNPAEFV